MDKEVQAFLDKAKEKAGAKAKSLEAVGYAKLAELEGRRDAADAAWATVAEYGFSEGYEGKLAAELQDLADKYVAAHPDTYAFFEGFVRPDGTAQEQEKAHDALVAMCGRFRKSGDYESAAKAEMFEMARFPRKNIGSQARINYRGVHN